MSAIAALTVFEDPVAGKFRVVIKISGFL